MKTCSRCHVEKPLTEFNRSKYAKDGVRSQCKACMTIERDRLRSHYKEWREQPERKAKYRSYRIETYDPIKAKARNAVRTAVKNGTLIRQPCEVCAAIKVEAHHDDYTKPLNVRWLCLTHHKARHVELRQQGLEP